ncbi:hypothetical protein [Beijerinckia mobilis]|uniref:hypothetical protein n=1 Tax=Beijerinckia mobilis TaxID=231434 RepID=UPI0012ECA259|nr:hypothetical protein [Beijerinckia mobilis]
MERICSRKAKAMIKRNLLCFAHGHGTAWEAICLDLDIAVQGHSADEVFNLLKDSISDYLKAANDEPSPAREKLLNRKAPFFVRVRYLFGFFWHALHVDRKDNETEHGFTIPCHA